MTYLISEIEKLYPDWYNKSSDLTYEDQKWIWENVPLPDEDEMKLRALRTSDNGSVSVSGSVSDTRRLGVNSEQNWHKSTAISRLKHCNSSTSPNELRSLLGQIFNPWTSKNRHWLWVAQNYTARTINWVMSATIKEFVRGGIRKNPPAYFTYLLKYRKKRKQFGSTNGARK